MSEFVLTAQSPLRGAQLDFDGVILSEVTGRAIVSIARPIAGDDKLGEAIASAYAITIPKIGQSATSPDGTARLLAMQQDQFFVLFDYAGNNAVAIVKDKLEDIAYCTDQSDTWVMLTVSGPASRRALERICPIDLHPQTFVKGSVARTVMEHLGTIILHEEHDKFLLMSPRSSAKSFLHAVETSIRNNS